MSSPNVNIYVQKFVAAILGITGVEISQDQSHVIFQEISRQVEENTPIRDQWGNWDWQYSDAQRRGKLYVPWLDWPIVELRDKLRKQNPQWPWEPIWPNGKRFALCLSHDIDVVTEKNISQRHPLKWLTNQLIHRARPYNNQSRLLKSIQQKCNSYVSPSSDKLWHFEDWLKLEDQHDFKSTFFIFPSIVHPIHSFDCQYHFDDTIIYKNKKMPVSRMVQSIHQAGWEIGLHGSIHSAKTTGMLNEQKKQIEDIIGNSVISIRQHYLKYDSAVTPKLQADAGFKVDSTQGYNRSIGFRAGTSYPYYCFDLKEQVPLNILEIPQHIMDGALFNPNALEYNEDMAIHHCLEIMSAVESVQGILTLSWHPHYMNNSTWWNVYKTLLEEAAHRNAWGCSIQQIYQWWTKREQRILNRDFTQ